MTRLAGAVSAAAAPRPASLSIPAGGRIAWRPQSTQRIEQRGQRQRAEPGRSRDRESRAARRPTTDGIELAHGRSLAKEVDGLVYIRVIVSCRFNSTRTTEVQAASSTRSAVAGVGSSPTDSNLIGRRGIGLVVGQVLVDQRGQQLQLARVRLAR